MAVGWIRYHNHSCTIGTNACVSGRLLQRTLSGSDCVKTRPFPTKLSIASASPEPDRNKMGTSGFAASGTNGKRWKIFTRSMSSRCVSLSKTVAG